MQIQDYIVSVWWVRGDLLANYGTQVYVFKTREEAVSFALDKDRSLRSKYDFNWLNAGYRFWKHHILVTVTSPGGETGYGQLLFTFSEEEVRQMCPERGHDLETALAEREEMRKQTCFPINVRFEKESK